MSKLQVHKHGDNYKVELYYSNRERDPIYTNILDRDPIKLASVLMDLYREGFPIEEAVKIFLNKITQRDWMGL
jgi:hypothetical protein